MGKGHMKIVSGGGHHAGIVHHNPSVLNRRDTTHAKRTSPAGGFISQELQDELSRESEEKFGSAERKSSSSPPKKGEDDEEKKKDDGHKDELRRRQSTDKPIPDECTKGGFITGPSYNSTIDALSPVTMTWLPDCLPSKDLVDIYLFAPGLKEPHKPLIHNFTSIPNTGSVSLEFKPRWWDLEKPRQLHIQVLPHGVPSYLSEFPAGPLFYADWTTPEVKEGDKVDEALDPTVIDGPLVVGASAKERSLTSGKTAVAVLIPLLALALGGFAFFKWKRKRGLEKRKDWAEQVDKRMSTISTDWKSVTVAGAQAGIRSSMAVSRASMAGAGGARGSFAFGNIRPQSNFGDMDEKAGVLGQEDGGFDKAQRRPGVGLRNPSGLGAERGASSVYTNRTSRVSFADQARPSMDRRTKNLQDTYIPPVPQLPGNGPARRPSTDSQSSDDISNATSGQLSPTQSAGAITLTPEDIRARIAAGRARADSRSASAQGSHGHGGARSESRAGGGKMADRGMSEVDGDVFPALAMMRQNENDDYLLSQPTPPAATYTKPMTGVTSHTSGDGAVPLSPAARTMAMSPVMHTLPMQALPASVMSPDDMLRAYAERKKSGMSGIAYPQPPAPSAPAPGGRTLFNGMVSPTHTGETPIPKVPQLGFGVGEYDSNFSFGQQANTGFEQQSTGNGHLETPSSPLSKRKSASNNPYFAHAQQTYGQPPVPQTNDAYAYDASYAAGPYAIGEVENDDGDVVQNRAGRGAYRG
ncbi:hypothetical protein BKA70DRAFT_1437957 [Coprinopsis sp. MPI-PUGE-AT-0042]|nr:hypothetical protein BKA70DRAFT_1437957 [Coprinopsis sp. MPI-PUGE-AT-0042]